MRERQQDGHTSAKSRCRTVVSACFCSRTRIEDDDDGENQLFLADVIFGERIINELFAVRRCESQREGEKNGRRRCEPDRERERAKELVIDVYPSNTVHNH